MKKTQYAPNDTKQMLPMNRSVMAIPTPQNGLTENTILDLTKGQIRKLRKLVGTGKVDRKSLPLTATSNNRLFHYLGRILDDDITPTYNGVPFNFQPVTAVPASVMEVQAEVIVEVKPIKVKKTPAKKTKAPVVKAEILPILPAKVTKKPAAKTTKAKAKVAK